MPLRAVASVPWSSFYSETRLTLAVEMARVSRCLLALGSQQPSSKHSSQTRVAPSQAIGLTEEWLASNAAEASTSEPAAAEAAPRKRRSRFEPMSAASDGINPALPAHLVAQIRFAKARSALQGQGPKSWAVGAACQARYSDGQWYNATVKSLTAEGQYLVNWDGSENHESVDTVDARPRDIAVRPPAPPPPTILTMA